ncbi:MAG: o-succinylbenzoate synthase [Cytophagales bacterium]|nr:o-succinylbenzoate synthase [Bernardetiaceae bacterium]MDW8205172.1 o-succinylbenzoate synthase [Cytophagales bacterium]
MLTLSYQPHLLHFKFEAGTSRGIMTERLVWFIFLTDVATGLCGIGEVAPLAGLSTDFLPDYSPEIEILSKKIQQERFHSANEISQEWIEKQTKNLPALRFALETAVLDLQNGGKRLIYDNPFYHGSLSIPINGLIWMGNAAFMLQQIEEKLAAGFSCLKMKIGAIDFATELNILASIRNRFSANEITLRVDANGAFTPSEAQEKLHALANLGIHSIEQPIRPRQWEAMAALCRHSPVPIALDEELIGIDHVEAKKQLLETLRPAYIILKPSLVGGLNASAEWIALAEQMGIGWWMTSALESNIGLNAICQFTARYQPTLPQGLGTGQLYHNNINSPLTVKNGRMQYVANSPWASLQPPSARG